MGLKENVIIGKLIPARAPIDLPPRPVIEELHGPRHLLEGEEGFEADDLELEIDDDLDLDLDLDEEEEDEEEELATEPTAELEPDAEPVEDSAVPAEDDA
jgi:hypothetical protein